MTQVENSTPYDAMDCSQKPGAQQTFSIPKGENTLPATLQLYLFCICPDSPMQACSQTIIKWHVCRTDVPKAGSPLCLTQGQDLNALLTGLFSVLWFKGMYIPKSKKDPKSQILLVQSILDKGYSAWSESIQGWSQMTEYWRCDGGRDQRNHLMKSSLKGIRIQYTFM